MYCRTLSAAVLGLVVIGGVHLTAQAVQPSPQGAGRVSKSVSAEARLDALSRAHVWKAPDVPVSEVRMAGHPAPPPFISCKFKNLRTRRHRPEVRLRPRQRRRDSGQVRPHTRDSVRGRSGPAAAFAGIRRRRGHARPTPALSRLSGHAVHHDEGRGPHRNGACLREGRRLQHAQRLRVGGGRAEARRPADRDRPGQGLGLSRARSGRRSERAARRARTSMPCA